MRSCFAAAALLTAAAPALAADNGIWKVCVIDSASKCTPARCTPVKPAISIFVSDYMDRGTEHSAYYRCGLKLAGCDRYNAAVYRAGEFIIFSLPQHSAFAKLGPDGRITDVAAVSDDVLISRGTCTTGAPPPDSSLRSR